MNEYPDVKIDQLVNVLLTRGDVSRGEARQVRLCQSVFSIHNFLIILWKAAVVAERSTIFRN